MSIPGVDAWWEGNLVAIATAADYEVEEEDLVRCWQGPWMLNLVLLSRSRPRVLVLSGDEATMLAWSAGGSVRRVATFTRDRCRVTFRLAQRIVRARINVDLEIGYSRDMRIQIDGKLNCEKFERWIAIP